MLTIDRCTEGQLGEVLLGLNDEFVVSKGRTGRVQERFTTVLSGKNVRDIYVATTGGSVCSCVVAKRFSWLLSGRERPGAMLGFVYTRPADRGKGYAGQVLSVCQQELATEGVDFGVLWTRIPNYYKRFGWCAGDVGVLGEVTASSCRGKEEASDVTCTPLDASTVALCEVVRTEWCKERIVRSACDYRTVPFPADRVSVHYTGRQQRDTAYALVGWLGECAYVYEMIGRPTHYHRLLASIVAGGHRVYVNAAHRSAVVRELTGPFKIKWQEQNLAMWLPLSDESDTEGLVDRYIPYFDRI